MADVQEPPQKKRRFFVDESPEQNAPLPLSCEASRDEEAQPPITSDATPSGQAQDSTFDATSFRTIAGENVAEETVRTLQGRYGNDIERAANAYFDGSWKTPSPQKLSGPTHGGSQIPVSRKTAVCTDRQDHIKVASAEPSRHAPVVLDFMPVTRYIGALGVTAWMTKSGTGLLKPGDVVRIERYKPPVGPRLGKGGKMKQVARKGPDVLVRFTDVKGNELGRLEQEQATWISALLDQKVCEFHGHCIYAPERVRTNDTVYLQLRCHLRRQVFNPENFMKPLDKNRQTGLFEAAETSDERALRMRQIGLVKLFSEINLHPSKINQTTAKHRRDGILKAAEIAEQNEQQSGVSTGASDGNMPEDPQSSPPSAASEDSEELEQDQLDSLYKKAQSFDFNTPEAEPEPTFVMCLRKYQKQALHWMSGKEISQKQSHKERSMHPLWEEYCWPEKDVEDKPTPKVPGQDCFYVNPYSGELSLDFPVQEQNCLGGILADEMGLGKTIEMLALIHSQTSPEQRSAMNKSGGTATVNGLSRVAQSSSTVEPAPATTLVVAPMSLLAQWASEAEKASKAGSLKTLVYYGSEKSSNLQTLCCAANSASAPNVIITSYGVVLSEYNSVASAGGNRASHGGLFSVEYFRIILDEAHMIKNRQSKTAKACYELSAVHRWCLTGTPIVNRLEDLFSLVRFLRVEPWSNFSFWKTFITTPFEKGDFVRALDVVQTVLEPLVLRRTKDMRTPDGEALVPLPPRTIDIEYIELSQPERDVYNHIYARAKRTFAANVEAGTLMKSYTTIFAQILRLRQTCCHPILTRNKQIVAEEESAAAGADLAAGLADDMDLGFLIEKFEAEEGEQDAAKYGAHVLKQIREATNLECPLCFDEPMNDQAVTGTCWHSACKKCILDWIEKQSAKGELPTCFNCREPINLRDIYEVIRHDDDDGAPQAAISTHFETAESTQSAKRSPPISLRRVNQLSSAKINTLLKHLKPLKRSAPCSKVVVFSQFTSFLDLLSPSLRSAGIHHLRFDGTLSQKDRTKVLGEFATTPTFTVLLLSLRAGGVGLNLTCASRVFMMDPWWSWAVEAQAIDRVHRMGQTEHVVVKRFVVGESIEGKMLKVQERKKFL